MAEKSREEPAPGPSLPSTPCSPCFPPPMFTPAGSRPRLTPRRQSRFTEEVMTDGTPAASISERSMNHYWYGASAENVNTNTNNTHTLSPTSVPDTDPIEVSEGKWPMLLRLLNGVLHVIPCLVLLVVLGYGMRVLREDITSYKSIMAIVLIFFLLADVVLDVITLIRAAKPWPTWGLVSRCVCGTAYITLFLVYVGLGDVFPEWYTYWGLPAASAHISVYVLLCFTGFWNILTPFPTAISTLLHLRPKPPTTTTTSTITTLRLADDDKRNSFNPRVSMAGTDVSSISMTWHRWVRRSSITQRSSAHYSSHNYSHDDLEIGFYHVHSHGYHNQRSVAREPSTDFTLREQPGEEDGDSERAGGLRRISSSRVSSSYEGHGKGGKEAEGEGREGGG